MSNDLISRKALIEVLKPFLDAECSRYVENMILGKIRYMPTAYDVDKVVEMIQIIEVEKGCHFECKNFDWSVGSCEGDCNDYIKNRAIEIVKGGAE